MSIETIQSKIARYGVTQPSRFELYMPVTPPSFHGRGWTGEDMRRMGLSAITASIPGRSLATSEVTTYGPVRRHPYAVNYVGEMSVEFLVSADYLERQMVHEWQDFVCDPETHDLRYYDEYVRPIIMAQLGREDNQPLYVVRINECFPVQIADIGLDWAQENSFNRVSVTFAFRDLVVLDRNNRPITPPRGGDGGLSPEFDRIVRGASAAFSVARSTINNFRL